MPTSYEFFVCYDFSTPKDLETMTKIFQDSDNKNREHYRWAKIAMYETNITEKIIKETELKDALELVNQSNREQKPHIGIQILLSHRNSTINRRVDIEKKICIH